MKEVFVAGDRQLWWLSFFFELPVLHKLNNLIKALKPKYIYFSRIYKPTLTQHIEDRYQESMITGTAFVDLSAAYDTVIHRLLIQKLFNITQDSTLCSVIRNLLLNRRFYMELNNKRRRLRLQKNGLPQGSVLSPTFLTYTPMISQSMMEQRASSTQRT